MKHLNEIKRVIETRLVPSTILVLVLAGSSDLVGQRVALLRDVRAVQVTPTIVTNPQKVKEDFAPNLVQDALRNALRSSNFEITEDAPIKAHIVLDEFSSGSTAKRVLVGLGAGRSSVAGRLVLQDGDSKELANIPFKVRGNLLFSGYQGGSTQRRQATAAFDQKLIEEIARLK
jgi:hypothetical protein